VPQLQKVEKKLQHHITGLAKSLLLKFNVHVLSNACTWKRKNLHIASPDL
jgi:hypothetical protein